MRRAGLTNGESVTLYDTSGPYTDPDATIDVTQGLPVGARKEWIEARQDTELYEGRAVRPEDNGYRGSGSEGAAFYEGLQRQPVRAKKGANVTQLHYARQGIITPEMEYVAVRENMRRDELKARYAHTARDQRLKGESFGATLPETVTPEFVRAEIARAAPSRRTSTTLSRADDHRSELWSSQRQHRQLSGDLVHRRGGREDGLGDPMGR